jgi:hypothetical protein
LPPGHRQAGTPTHELQKLGRWKTRSMVERYAQVAPEALQGAAGQTLTHVPLFAADWLRSGYDLATLKDQGASSPELTPTTGFEELRPLPVFREVDPLCGPRRRWSATAPQGCSVDLEGCTHAGGPFRGTETDGFPRTAAAVLAVCSRILLPDSPLMS